MALKLLEKNILTYYFVLADIGGQMGLCIGASLLTVCEMIELAVKKIIKTVRIRKKTMTLDTTPTVICLS